MEGAHKGFAGLKSRLGLRRTLKVARLELGSSAVLHKIS